jgi:hypothetical protein
MEFDVSDDDHIVEVGGKQFKSKYPREYYSMTFGEVLDDLKEKDEEAYKRLTSSLETSANQMFPADFSFVDATANLAGELRVKRADMLGSESSEPGFDLSSFIDPELNRNQDLLEQIRTIVAEEIRKALDERDL